MATEMLSLAQMKQALKGVGRPAFTKWIYIFYNKGYLDLVVKCLIEYKHINDPADAVQMLARWIPDEALKKSKRINRGDFDKSSTSKAFVEKLMKKINEKESVIKKNDKTRIYGTFGHSMCAQLFSGKLISYEERITLQLDAFSNGYEYELIRRTLQKSKKKISKQAFEKLLEKIKKEKAYIMKLWDQGHLPVQTSVYTELMKDLSSIFRGHLSKVIDYDISDPEDQYLSFLTTLTWVEVVLYYKKVGSFPLFSEVFIIENSADVGFGRIDILSVVSINGHKPTKKELCRIEKLSKRQFDSVGHVIVALVAEFGRTLVLKITDWKFVVGDGVNGSKKKLNIIHKDDVLNAPLQKHADQLDRYLSLSIVSHSLAAGFSKLAEIESLWETSSFTLIGELVYFSYDGEPIVHEVSMSKERIRSVFEDQIVSNFHSAKTRSAIRAANNLAMGLVNSLLEGKKISIDNMAENSSPLLGFAEMNEPLSRSVPTISQVILEHYKPMFLDPMTRTIEIVGKRDKPDRKKELEIHLTTVKECIDNGKIIAEPGFNWVTGGKICCPYHGEKSPSLSIPFDRKAHCFGCGITMDYNPFSIPEGVEIHMGKTTRFELDKLVIPPRHEEIMTVAQEILHRCFKNSPAEVYLLMERGLNPSIAHYFFGAGYGDSRLIKGLLEYGFTFDELLHFGLLGLTTSKNAHNNSTVKVLKCFGYTLETMSRPTVNKKGEHVSALPYSILENRITFPLEVYKKINSIYGRSLDPLCPKNLRHRKVRAKETRMLHGGLNISLAVEAEVPYIMVSEAGLNAITLVEMANDIKAQTANCGVTNYMLLELLARSKAKNIIFAYDFDKPKWNKNTGEWGGEAGQLNTVMARDALVEYGYTGGIYTVTPRLAMTHPNYDINKYAYNDVNKFWTEFRRKINVLDYIEEIPQDYVNSMGGRCKKIVDQFNI